TLTERVYFYQMEPQRAVYRQRAPYSPYQNQNPVNTFGRKKYLIHTPRPGVKADEFHSIEALCQLKKSPVNPKRSMVEDIPILLKSRDRRILIPRLIVPRMASSSASATLSAQNKIVAVQKVTSKGDDIVTHLEKRKMSFGVSCSECSLSFYSRMQLCHHASTAHGIPAPLVHKMFDSDDLFREWLSLVKRTHAVDFVHSSGSRSYSGREQKITYLQCSRSGEQKVIASRNVKRPRGTMKCGKTCLAYLKTTQALRHGRPWGAIKVEGCLQHSGHTISPERILLTPEEEGAIQQLIERNRRSVDTPIDITVARAILYPCARFRLITDEELLQILPRWFWQMSSEREVGWNGNESEFERDLPQSSTIDGQFEALDHQILGFDGSDDFVSVV
ncbi:hypothetical protein PMAYCL1PPCAC_06984, partial [Pristionchus mayeri]